MNAVTISILTGVGMVGGLLTRRLWRIYAALRAWKTIAHLAGLATLPPAYFRVALTGCSSGIGRACASLLSKYESVNLIRLGRRPSESSDIVVDLSDDSSVRTCVNELSHRWYKDSKEPSMGQDIVINNAGIFGSSDPARVWETNLIAPAFMTEAMSDIFSESNSKGRTLRFVQVCSRLEMRSVIDRENVRTVAHIALANQPDYASVDSYADSKRCLILHAAYMCSKFASNSSLSYVTMTPGMVNTGLGRESVSSLVWFLAAPVRFLLLRHPIEGAVAVLWVAFGCPGETGVYTADPNEILERISHTRDVQAGRVVSEIVNEHFNIV